MAYALPEIVKPELKLLLDVFHGQVPKPIRQHIAKKYGIPLWKITPWLNFHYRTHGWCGSGMLDKHAMKFMKYHPKKPFPKCIRKEMNLVWNRIWNVIAFQKAHAANTKVVISIDHFALLANQAVTSHTDQLTSTL